nr:MAG TPA: hypothetical protein [Bacteriophage sp.]
MVVWLILARLKIVTIYAVLLTMRLETDKKLK